MKKFKFSLETVLSWKRAQEEDALKVLGAATRQRQLAFDTLQASRRQLGALLQSVREAREGRLETWTQVAYLREVSRQEAFCRGHEELLQRAVLNETRAREAYLERRRQAEIIEKLKEKRQESYRIETERTLEQELEEIMLSRV